MYNYYVVCDTLKDLVKEAISKNDIFNYVIAPIEDAEYICTDKVHSICTYQVFGVPSIKIADSIIKYINDNIPFCDIKITGIETGINDLMLSFIIVFTTIDTAPIKFDYTRIDEDY